jgi:hypothetical protein
MFDTVNEIETVIRQSETDQNELRQRFIEHEEYATGKEYVTPLGYESYTSPKPQNFMDKIVDGLNRAQFQLQIKLAEDVDEDERRAASQAELYLFGALQDIDRNLVRRNEPPLREGLGYLMALRGWYALKALVYEKKGATLFDVAPWDMAHVCYEHSSTGLLWCSYKRWASKAAIQKEHGLEVSGKGAIVTDFWDQDRNSSIIENEFRKPPTAHNLEEIPVLINAVASRPSIQDKNNQPTLVDRGHSVFQSAIHTFEPTNRFISQLMDIHGKSITGSIVHQSKTGQKKLAGDPHAKYMEIQIEEGEKVEMLELPIVPAVTAALLGILDSDGQQSMLPYPLAFGGANENFSGRALVQLNDATQSVYTPRTGALGTAYVWLAEQLMTQFASKGKAQDFRGTAPDGRFFKVKIKPNDLKEGWFVSAQFTPSLPRDLEGDIQAATMATNPTGPNGERLVSLQTAREDILKLRDPDAEKDKVLEEYGESLPPIVIQNVAAALERKGKPEIAQQVLALNGPVPPAGDTGAGAGAGGTIPPDQQLAPEIVQQIAQVFIDAGQEELGAAVLQLLGVDIPNPPSANGAVPSPAATV